MSTLNKLKRGRGCAAFGCSMRTGTNLLSEVKLFSFPSDPERRKQWKQAVKRDNWSPKKNSQLCNRHFKTGKPSSDPLHPDYVPSIFCFKRKNPSSISRYERHAKRLKTDASHSEGIDTSNAQAEENDVEMIPKNMDCGIMTDLTMEDIKKMEEKNQSYQSLTNMLQKSAKETTSSKVMSNSKMFEFYTKLPNITLFHALLRLILDNWKPNVKTVLESAEQLLLVLMKLRLGLLNEDLAYRFDIGSGTVSVLFREWIARMAFVMSDFIRQPSRKTLEKSVPLCFSRVNLQDVTCVIDCTEIFIDRPFNLDARAQTYSNYKHHNTVKFLVGCTPSGGISFISKTFGGRHSDKEITKLSGFLDTVKENDVILADRGFTIEELVAQRNATVILPPFTKGKKQLSAAEVMHARKISRVRIHVERCIGQMKSYGILKHQWPITFINDKWMTPGGKFCTGDHIITVIAALCNVSRNSIIKNQ